MSLKLRRQILKLHAFDKFHVSVGLQLDEEIVIIAVRPKISDGKKDLEGTRSMKCDYEKELYEVNQPVTRRPGFLPSEIR